jgi:ubiquinone/menaquinone biosynthesis C-methylase UbiE
MGSRAWDILWRLWYPVLTRLTRNAPVSFLNYGYSGAGEGPVLSKQDESDRACIQLYHHVVGAIDVRGLSVLEVSCGHGGGASYVARYLKPASVLGVDRNPRAVERCQQTHRVDGLMFAVGDAMALDFEAARFDVVVDVEASHCYPDVPQFLREVVRVLRPGGHVLYADFRPAGAERDRLHAQLLASGLVVDACEDISPGVVRGMAANSGRSAELVRRLVPTPLRPFARMFAGVEGSPIYRSLASGGTVYFRYVLRKAEVPA